MHVGLRSPVPWVDVFPAEFALAPGTRQRVTVEMAPERSREALVPVDLSFVAQYIAVIDGDAPSDVRLNLPVIPPAATCPTCATPLPETARECRKCGERIRLCRTCATPNTWIASVCRRDAAHVLRTEADWMAAPGGDSRHAATMPAALPTSLSRCWSAPSFPPVRVGDALEWSAPLAAFGIVVAAAIDTAGGRASVHAFEVEGGAPLWDWELPDPRGIYPDRGGLALASDGLLYASTLGGHLVALDIIRGTSRWSTLLEGAAYGSPVVAGAALLATIGNTLVCLDRQTGAVRRVYDLGARVDTSACAGEGAVFAAAEDGTVHAFDLADGRHLWVTNLDAPFDAAPVLRDGVVYASTMEGTVAALSAGDGAVRWRTRASSRPIAVSPAVSSDGLLFVAADDGNIHIIAASTGNLVRSRRVSSAPLRTSAVCSGSTVFIGADDGNIYALDADYAVRLAYETTPGARIASAGLALYGDRLIFTATNGLLYVLRARE
ncbi:MAG: PQQ-binding-like beta-propeller repeat protein [Capsulimonadaceae bacterium]